jgi:hypothetical protein
MVGVRGGSRKQKKIVRKLPESDQGRPRTHSQNRKQSAGKPKKITP